MADVVPHTPFDDIVQLTMRPHLPIPDIAQIQRIPLRLQLSPEAALLAIREEPWPFALWGNWADGGAILGSRPLAFADPRDDPLALLDRLPRLEGQHDDAAIGGGWFGWLGYGLGSQIERLPPQPPRPAPLPEAHLAYYDHLLRCDRDGQWWFEALLSPGREQELQRRLAQLRGRLASPPSPDGRVPGQFRPVPPSSGGHIAAVSRCLEKIRAGEIFQANLRLRLAASWNGDLASLFARAAGALRPAYGAAFIAPWGGVASMSPELFLRRTGSSVETAPIKGTIACPDEPRRAEAALRSLQRSSKDGAEHVMIVDVARNDLGRVCEFGSVEASSAPSAEAYSGLWHLVSRVRGRLRPGAGDAELIRASFPPASVTGAPKIQAMRAIAELEPLGREVYTGALGYASPAAGLELSVAIRTFEAHGDRLWLDAGGGIVADSSPEQELEECIAKARPLVEATGSGIEIAPLAGSPAAPEGHRPPAALAGGRDRPDPAHGLIETILVQEGRPRRLDEHLARLAASLEAVYGASPEPGLRERLIATAASDRSGGLRVKAAPDGHCEVASAPLRRREIPVPLEPFTLPGGLGAHKWANRSLLEALGARGATPLLVDGDGLVLEAGWGNVWIEEAGRLLTPPADGRILPGVTRASILRGESEWPSHAAEAPITLERLIDADAVLVSSSLAGLVPASLTGRAVSLQPTSAPPQRSAQPR